MKSIVNSTGYHLVAFTFSPHPANQINTLMSTFHRCQWASSHTLLEKYHDQEWGVPIHEDQKLFEFLTLEAFQAGLSWLTVLKKREAFAKAFDNFDWKKIALYSTEKTETLIQNASIIRNKLKINATIANAIAFEKTIKEFGSFDKYIWSFVNNNPIQNQWTAFHQLPSVSEEAEKMSKDLKKRGFKFVGPTICYAFMQAIGMVNDHETSCFRYREVQNQNK